MTSLKIVFISFFAVVWLAACTSDKEVKPLSDAENVEALYQEAAAASDKGLHRKAGPLFEEVERQYPYSDWATRAQLMAAYSYYEALEYDEAILALDRFIQLHPGSDQIDYAYYLRALCYYEQISDVSRDQTMTQEALKNLKTVTQRFPESKYARDSQLKMDLTHDHLAGKEMDIGRYYLERKHYNAAINRFREVVEGYQTTTHVPEALHRLVESYLALGIEPEALKVAAVLGHNFPGSAWYQDSYVLFNEDARAELQGVDTQKSWMGKAWDKVKIF